MQQDYVRFIVDWLRAPERPDTLRPLLKYCLAEVAGYLAHLERCGRRLPVDLTHSQHRHANLANDLLGRFFRRNFQGHYTLVDDYFTRHGIIDYIKASENALAHHFKTLLIGFVKRELGDIAHEENSQVENLKGTFRDALKLSNLCRTETRAGAVYLSIAPIDLETIRGAELISSERLLTLVEAAFLESRNAPEWLRQIFERLRQETDVPPILRQSDLVSAVVIVHSRYMIDEAPYPAQLPGPQNLLLRQEIDREREAAVAWSRQGPIANYLRKGEIDETTASLYHQAVALFLLDFSNGGEDSRGTYFRAVMPAETHADYVKKYKYLFEMILTRAEDNFAERLRNNPIIRGPRGYR